MIGVFDSGLGGLSVLAAIARALPGADLAYLADSAHIPYGNKSDAFIRERVLAIGGHLAGLGCDVLVVACNTATAAAVDALREAYPQLAVIGVEPGVKPAAAGSRSRRIAVLTTESTACSERLARLITTHAADVGVEVVACPGWATRVETLRLDDPDFIADIDARVSPLLARGVDRLVLGCTHYSFLEPTLTPLLKGRAQLVDVAEAVAREVSRRTRPTAGEKSMLRLMATARPELLHRAMAELGLGWLVDRTLSAASLVTC